MQSHVQVTVFGMTDRGQSRATNQDAFFITDLSPEPRWPPVGVGFPRASTASGPLAVRSDHHGLALLVADGMGGGPGGIASHMASRTIQSFLDERRAEGGLTRTRLPRLLAEAVEMANARIHHLSSSQPELEGMGTTATLAGLLGRTLTLAHVGDSRAYLLRDGALSQLTRDQSLVQRMVDRGLLSKEQAEVSELGNLILQAVGVDSNLEVAVSEHGVLDGDVLLLCSDGLSGLLSDADIQAILLQVPGPLEACQALVRHANDRGGPDNVTAVVAYVG